MLRSSRRELVGSVHRESRCALVCSTHWKFLRAGARIRAPQSDSGARMPQNIPVDSEARGQPVPARSLQQPLHAQRLWLHCHGVAAKGCCKQAPRTLVGATIDEEGRLRSTVLHAAGAKHGSYEHDVLGLIVTQSHCHPAEVTSVGEQHVAWQANGQRGAYVQLAWSGPNSVDVAVPRRGRTGSAQDERAHNRLRLKKRIRDTLRLALGGPVEAPSRTAVPSRIPSAQGAPVTNASRALPALPSQIPEQFPEFAKLRRARLGRVSPRARRRRRARPRRGGGGCSNSDS